MDDQRRAHRLTMAIAGDEPSPLSSSLLGADGTNRDSCRFGAGSGPGLRQGMTEPQTGP